MKPSAVPADSAARANRNFCNSTCYNQMLKTTKLQPYLSLLRDNKDYRQLWLSQVVSNFGDWFGILAVYELINRYSNSEFLLGLIIVVKMLSLASFSPVAGYITDRFNRRQLMIWCDIIRAVIVAGFLLIRSADILWLTYVLMALQMMLSAIFEPAKTSSIPNVTTDEELVHANILSSLSWSIIFTVGMGVGGLATAFWGTDAVFIVDVFTYVLSAWFIYHATIPQFKASEGQAAQLKMLQGIKEGFSFLRRRKDVLRPALAKGAFTVCIGSLVYMLILVSENVLLMGSMGTGLLYASRGIGTAIGPIIGRRLFQDERKWVTAMGAFMMFAGLNYFGVAWSQQLWLMLIFVFIAHAASGANWVMSTVLLQRRAPDHYRGRVFSTEWLVFTLAQSGSVMLASWILEMGWLTLPQAIGAFSILLVIIGAIWVVWIGGAERRHHSDHAKKRASVESTLQEA
jgi:MFS family permease